MGRPVAAALAALALVLASGAAAAQEGDVQRTALARSLFREGVALSEQGEWAQAADRFRRSLSLRDSSVVAFNLATACMHVGRLVEAVELFGRASRDDGAPERLRAAAIRQRDALRPRLGRLTLEVEGPREGVVIELDGLAVPRERLGVGAPADPGHHRLAAVREGEEVARAEAEVPEGGDATLRLAIPPPPAPEPPAAEVAIPIADPLAEPDPPPPTGDDLLVWIGVIAGVVAVATAATITTIVVLDGQGPAAPIEGNLGPPVIVFD